MTKTNEEPRQIFSDEESLWRQRIRVQLLVSGDRNTKFSALKLKGWLFTTACINYKLEGPDGQPLTTVNERTMCWSFSEENQEATDKCNSQDKWQWSCWTRWSQFPLTEIKLRTVWWIFQATNHQDMTGLAASSLRIIGR